MKTRDTSSAARRVLIVLGMAAAMLATAFALRWWPQRTLGKQWQQQLATVPDERTLEHCERIATLGDPGTRILVGALASPRQQVARSAQIVLGQQVERWSAIRDVARRTQRVTVLVESLAEQVDRFSPTARRFAADLVLRVTAWPANESIDRIGLIAQAEKVVRAATSQPPSGERPPADRPTDRIADRRGEFGQDASGQVRFDRLTDLPGGQIPVGSVLVPSYPGANGNDSRPDEPGQPRLLDSYPDPGPPPEDPGRIDVDPSDARPLQPRVEAADVRSIAANVGRSSAAENLQNMPWLDVFRRLHSDSAKVVAAAETELLQRGFLPIEFQLGRQLTDPDISRRLALARQLPTLRGIDAGRWLVELTRDEDADVRLAAFSTLATSRNRQIRDHVLSHGRRDEDARIRRLAEQLGRGLRR